MLNNSTKKIQVDYQDNIGSLESEQKNTDDIINNIYNRFINEKNLNNREYALQVLKDYRYVPNKYVVPAGRYIRYIDTTNEKDMKLKLGGFVINDNKYSLTFKTNDKFVKLNKRHCIMFVSITRSEQIRSMLNSL